MRRDEPLPKVTPYLLERAAQLCPRRLRRAYQNQRGDTGAFMRGRVRDALLADAISAHTEMGPPNPDSFRVRSELLPEEQAVQSQAIRHYLELFESESVRAVDHEPYDSPVERRGVLVGGWVDLVCERADGDAELRQFEVWGRSLDADPTTNFTLLLATLRLLRWIDGRPLWIRHADLVNGQLAELRIDTPAVRSNLVAIYEQRLMRIGLRSQGGEAIPGEHCTACPYVPGCPAFGGPGA